MTGDPASADPRAFRMADSDGKPLAVFTDGEGSVWLDVHGELARLDRVQAMKLGGRLGGAAQRALGCPGPASPSPDDRTPIDARGMDIAYQVVADRLERRIRAGEFSPGRRLPAEHELTAWYGVSRSVIVRARRVLLERGMVVSSPGIGIFIA